MKYLFTTALTFFSILSFGQFNCIDGEVWSCNGFVDDANIFGNLDFSDNSISSYTCDGSTIGFSLGSGLNDLYGQDDIYIFNSIGQSGSLNSMTVTLTMDSNSDLDMIAISSDCSYNCFDSDSYTFSGTGVSETITLEWEDEQTIILIVEAYHLDGGGDYQLNFQYNNAYNFCSYFPFEGTPITCSPSNLYSGSLFPVNCITSFPTDCPPEITYHEGEGPYFANEHVYTFAPDNSGTINIDLSLSGGMKAFLYHKYSVGIDFTPIVLIGSGTNFISTSFTLNGFDEFFLIIDGPDQGSYPYSFFIDFPGCNPLDECGDCFSYTEIGNGKCKIDNSLTPSCGNEEWSYTNWPNGGNSTTFTLNNSNEVQFPIAGDYLVCYTHFCDDLPTLALNADASEIGKTCCIVISIGESCSEPPVAHFTGSANIQGSNIGHINFFNSNSSLNADSYSWHWGDGSTNSTSQTNISHDYPLEPNPLNLCMVASNECGMSKYCISYDTYGDGFSQFDCGLSFNPYSPPPIYPFVDGNTLSISDLSFACGAGEITFDPGDGSGEYPISCNGVSYTYPDEQPYVCCVRIKFPCFTICFCYTVRGGGFDCENDPWQLECNDSGDIVWNDSTNPNNHSGISNLSDIVGNHNSCVGTNDGWEEDNTLAPNVPFDRHEIIYEIINPNDNHLGDITIDLIMLQANQDLDVFVYGSCDGNGDFSNCIASSSYNNSNPQNKRDAILLTGVPAFEKYYVIVDGQSNAPTTNEGNFQISYTCGSICEKDAEAIQCGQTISSSTFNETNKASYYCNCQDESILGPAGNFGPEKKYRLDIQQTSNVTITLDITTPNIDLELYLLNECSSSFCNTNSRNSTNESEIIQKTLSAGTYYIVVEGFAGNKGNFDLSVSGCEIQPVPSNNCELESTYTFENFNDGDLIPTDDNSGLWEYGITYSEDPFDDKLDAVIEAGNSKKLVLNAGNYFYSDVRFNYENASEGIRKIEWDHTFQYVDGDLYGGAIKLFEQTPLLDFSQELAFKYGYDDNGNYAELYYNSFGLLGMQSTKLANILSIENYNGTNETPTFKLGFVYNLDNDQFSFLVNEQAIYTGNFNFETFLLENRAISFSADDDQDYMEIDNISVYSCEDCSITYDDDCNNIFLTSIDQGSNGNVSVTLDQSGISENSIQGYQVIDEQSEEITELNSLNYAGCVPGRSYKFCILYLDEENCLKACCYRFTIPLNCLYWLPYYSGDNEDISYTYQSENLPSGYDVQQWFVDGSFAGGSNSITQAYSGAQSSFVCCIIYDPFSKQYIICCRNVCTQIATDCNNVTVSYDSESETYDLGVVGASEVLSWDIDIPTNLPNNGKITDPTMFRPSDYGISPGEIILVSVKYIDNNGCVKVCCKEIEIPVPQDAVIFDIGEECGPLGSTIDIPVTLLNFNDVGIVGFELYSTDITKVRLEGIVNLGTEFNTLQFNVVNNKIILGWDHPQGLNITVPDGTHMFDIRVTLLTQSESPVSVFGSELEVLGDVNLASSIISGSACVSLGTNISGIVKTKENQPLQSIDINLNDGDVFTTQTNNVGLYTYENITGSNVEIEATKNDNIREGVTNSDVALIRRHYLQINNLNSDYKLIAADVNRNGSITNSDVALARRIYLEVITDEIPNNTSWRFIPEDLDISNNPLDQNLDQKIRYSNPAGTITNANFIGVKIGDVNNTVGLQSAEKVISSRSAPLSFIIDDVNVTQGSTVTIPLRVTDFENIALFGFEMTWDKTMLNLTDIQPVNLNGFSSQNYNILDGKVIIGWDEPNGSAIDFEDGPILNFTFEIGDMSMGSTQLEFSKAEILDEDFSEVEHTFVSGDIVVETTSIEELENEGISVWPNPSILDVTIEYKGDFKYEIYNISSQLIGTGVARDKIVLNDNNFQGAGVYFIGIYSGEAEELLKVIRL